MKRVFLRTIISIGIPTIIATTSIGVAEASPSQSGIRGNVTPAIYHSHLIKHHNGKDILNITVGLKIHNSGQLKQFLRDEQNPKSSCYHKFLTPDEFTAEYSPSEQDVAIVTTFLRNNGISVDGVSRNRLLVHAHATTNQLEKVLGITVNNYANINGTFYAADSNPVIPSNLAPIVQSIMGLETATQMVAMNKPGNGGSGKPGGSGTTTTPPLGYSPQQIAQAYNWPSVTSTTYAAGQSIAIATAYGYNSNDLSTFWNQYGLPNHNVYAVYVDGRNHQTNTETTIDIERSGAMAPGANILVYEAANTYLSTFTDLYNKIITDDNTKVMTTSWGTAERNMPLSSIQQDDQIFIQAAAEGISVFAASGDSGSADGTSNQDTADYPSSYPYVTATGGTTLNIASNGTISSETAWSGSGGAESSVFSEPSWQVGTGVTEDGKRQTSDIALDADPSTGYSVFYNGSWSVYGGTSFVAPEMAALFAIKIGETGTAIGQSNSAIYQVANSGNYSSDFYDIISGNNGLFSSGIGWDHPTGWGSINVQNFITNLN